MIQNKRGLSTVVTTLIIILLVLVAIGIVWVVVRNVIQTGTGQIETKTKCINTEVKATAVDCADPAACIVTLKRAMGDDEIGGVKLVFSNGTDTSDVKDVVGNIGVLGTKETTRNSLLTEPNKVEVTVYFKDESGVEQICTQTSPFSFT